MKRYVREFAREVSGEMRYCAERQPVALARISARAAADIDVTVAQCVNGFMTDFEAVKMIVRIMDEYADENAKIERQAAVSAVGAFSGVELDFGA